MARVIEVTESMHSEGGGQQIHIPQGEYLMALEKVVVCTEKQWDDESKNPFMSVRARIEDGPVKSRPYSELLTWAPEGQFRMGRFMAALNVKRPAAGTRYDYAGFTRLAAGLTKALEGRKFGAFVGDNDYNGRVTSQIVEFYPAADYNDRKGAVPVAAAAPNGVSPTAPTANPLAAFESALGKLLPQAESA